MRLLALDAALGSCSAALLDDTTCLAEQYRDGRDGLKELPRLVATLLGTSALDAVAVTVGPGSFTGLRSAIGLAQGVALGREIPVVGVTVAEALAEGLCLPGESELWVALDTRRSRIFLVRNGCVTVTEVAELPRPGRPIVVAGDAAGAVLERLARQGDTAASLGPQAVSAVQVGRAGLRRLAGELPPCPAQPLYVEPPETRAASGLRPAPA